MTLSPARAGIPRFVSDDRRRPCVIGHRGASRRAPENTLAAFRLAFEAGADAIELDVQPTADRRLVVLHDRTLDHTTDMHGRVDRLRLTDVRRARCTFGGLVTDEPVPTLAGVLELLPPGKRCLIEVKTRGAASLVLDEIRRHGDAGSVGVCSFLDDELRWLRRQAPGIPLIQNLGWWQIVGLRRRLERAATLGAAGVFVFPRSVSPGLVERAHALGLELHAGPVETPDGVARLAAACVDAIETDDPAAVLSVLETEP